MLSEHFALKERFIDTNKRVKEVQDVFKREFRSSIQAKTLLQHESKDNNIASSSESKTKFQQLMEELHKEHEKNAA